MNLFIFAARYVFTRSTAQRRLALLARTLFAWRIVTRAELALGGAKWRALQPLTRQLRAAIRERGCRPPRRRFVRRFLHAWWFSASIRRFRLQPERVARQKARLLEARFLLSEPAFLEP